MIDLLYLFLILFASPVITVCLFILSYALIEYAEKKLKFRYVKCPYCLREIRLHDE